MVNEQEQDSGRKPANQGVRDVVSEPNKINASTPYDFSGKNLTPYGGLLPVITMLEKLGFQSLVEQTVTSKRIPRRHPERSAAKSKDLRFDPLRLGPEIT